MTRRGFAVTALGVGALLTVLGSLFPLYGVVNEFLGSGLAPDAQPVRYALTGWESVVEPRADTIEGGARDNVPVYGYAFALAAALVVLGAVLQFRSALSAAIGRVVAVVGFGLVAGTLWAAIETLSTLFGTADGARNSAFVGSGTYVVLVAAVLVLAGVVLAQDWPARGAVAGGVGSGGVGGHPEDDVDTPPFGIPVPVIEVRPINQDEVDHRRHPTGGNSSTVEY